MLRVPKATPFSASAISTLCVHIELVAVYSLSINVSGLGIPLPQQREQGLTKRYAAASMRAIRNLE